MKDGFIRVAAATPEVKVADCHFNKENILALARQAAAEGASLAVFPELSVTAYTCGDLFLQKTLVCAAENALAYLLENTRHLPALFVVGLPVHGRGALYNCACVFTGGRILGLVPKTYLPNYAEFYELRLFSAGKEEEVTLCGQKVPMGQMLFAAENMPDFVLGVEICEDLWAPIPPSSHLALAGATVIANLSASNEVVGKAEYRRRLVQGQSGRAVCAYVYACAGEGESTTDLVFSGHSMVAENGALCAESPRFQTGVVRADIDVSRLQYERRRLNSFAPGAPLPTVSFTLPMQNVTLLPVHPHPFIPADKADLQNRCEEILTIQATGLATRLKHTGLKSVVLGLSGGLDSTLALLVAVRACRLCGLPAESILAVTMPGFGTTSRTKNNANRLAAAYGATLKTVSIKKAVEGHFKDIGHTGAPDVTYENAQARERTQVLMDLANMHAGLVIGTGDLSELALGFATYNADHMSMYGVNASIPKTLVRYLIAHEADNAPAPLQRVLKDVLATPVSPELLPPENNKIAQKTEEIVGPYELHDFFLYYMMRFGFAPRKIYRLALSAFAGKYTPETVKHWLRLFYKRFFANQFKRSCLPDGPKVGSVTLSPRGDFRMPSDASAALWLAEADAL